jgi:hypothetical protein
MAEHNASITRVFIVCDDPLARAGLVAILGGRQELSIAGEGGEGGDAPGVSVSGADVVLWNLGAVSRIGNTPGHLALPLGLPAGLPVVALVPDGESASRALNAGAAGILTRDPDPVAIAAALCAVSSGLFVADLSIGAPPFPIFRGDLLPGAPPSRGRSIEPALQKPLSRSAPGSSRFSPSLPPGTRTRSSRTASGSASTR